MPIISIDGLPYVAPDWLQRRIAHDGARAERWRQKAELVMNAADPARRKLRSAYLEHALQATSQAERWRRALAVTLAALEQRR
jgi:hypothetical protein